jgi:hypothetical protein
VRCVCLSVCAVMRTAFVTTRELTARSLAAYPSLAASPVESFIVKVTGKHDYLSCPTLPLYRYQYVDACLRQDSVLDVVLEPLSPHDSELVWGLHGKIR